MNQWYLPTLSEVISINEPDQGIQAGSFAQQRVRAEREWCGAIAALNLLLERLVNANVDSAAPYSTHLTPGLILSGPLPVLVHPDLVSLFSTWTFTANPLRVQSWLPMQLLPASGHQVADQFSASMLPLLPSDPLAAEQFCLVLTTQFSLLMTLGETVRGEPAFLFSFSPNIIQEGWRSLRSRLLLTAPNSVEKLDLLVAKLPPTAPDYRIVSQFSRLMLANLPDLSLWDDDRKLSDNGFREHPHAAGATKQSQVRKPTLQNVVDAISPNGFDDEGHHRHGQPESSSFETLTRAQESVDKELLQAIAHEVRTPLTTIRTLTRLLLRRKDLSPDVIKRLEVIDQECTEQIDRFNLIFRAVELETGDVKHPLSPLSPISLAQVFQQNVPRWQQQAQQRNLTLDVSLPHKLPMVLADPTMLEQVLTGLIDRITHSLPGGSRIQVKVKLAGHQLKLQFHAQPGAGQDSSETGQAFSLFAPNLKSIGEMLMFQPETGSLSLNLSVTKNLFQALGGKLIVKQRPQQGEILTIYLPLETHRSDDFA